MLKTQIVYLAGPMSGLSKTVCNEWREEATGIIQKMLHPDGTNMFHVVNPVRGREWLTGLEGHRGRFPKMDKQGAGWGREVVRRDRYDVKRADIVLINFDVEAATNGLFNVNQDLNEEEQAALVKFMEKHPKVESVLRKEAARVSIGSIPELTWAKEFDKFALVVMNCNKFNCHDHAFVRDLSSLIVPTLKDALDYMQTVLNAER